MSDRDGSTWAADPGSIRLETIWRTLIRSLVLVTALLALSQLWLGNDEFATPLQPGLLLPVAAGGWLLSLRRARLSWQEL